MKLSLKKKNCDPQRHLVWSKKITSDPWGVTCLERRLLIIVVLTQRLLLEFLTVPLDALPVVSSAATCRSIGECSRKTLSLLPFVRVCKSARTGLTGRRPLMNKCEPKGTLFGAGKSFFSAPGAPSLGRCLHWSFYLSMLNTVRNMGGHKVVTQSQS